MLAVSETDWKRFIQADVQGLTQVNTTAGIDATRTYLSDGEPVAQMTVHGANTNTPGHECRRTFLLSPSLLAQTAHIVILTDEQWAEWDDFDGDDDEWLRDRGVVL